MRYKELFIYTVLDVINGKTDTFQRKALDKGQLEVMANIVFHPKIVTVNHDTKTIFLS